MTSSRRIDRGAVFLVGAGPGDPGLITVRGVECLRHADLVFYDYLTNPQLLDHVPKSAQRVCLDSAQRQETDQDELVRRMIDAAGQMKAILKGMASYVAAQDYLNAEAFLDKLAAEARGRLEDATAKKQPQK